MLPIEVQWSVIKSTNWQSIIGQTNPIVLLLTYHVWEVNISELKD